MMSQWSEIPPKSLISLCSKIKILHFISKYCAVVLNVSVIVENGAYKRLLVFGAIFGSSR